MILVKMLGLKVIPDESGAPITMVIPVAANLLPKYAAPGIIIAVYYAS